MSQPGQRLIAFCSPKLHVRAAAYLMMFMPSVANAQVNKETFVTATHNSALFPFNTSTLGVGALFVQAITITLLIAGFASIAFIMYSAIQLATAAGDESKIEQAKKALMWSIIGTFIILATFTVIYASQNAAQGIFGNIIL